MVNHCVVQLTLIILYMNYTSIKNKLKKKSKSTSCLDLPRWCPSQPPKQFQALASRVLGVAVQA